MIQTTPNGQAAACDQVHNLMASIVANSADGILAVDRARRIVIFNPAMERMTGYTAEDVLGKSCPYLLGVRQIQGESVCDSICPFLLHPDGATSAAPVDVQIQLKSGDTAWVEVSYGKMTDPEGSIIGVVHTFRDASARKELERAKDEFLSLISHDLRSPITSISGYTQLLLKMVNGKEERASEARFLETIKLQTNRLSSLIDTILDVSSMEAGRTALRKIPVPLAPLAESSVASFRPLHPGYQLKVEAQEGIGRVLADPQRIEQVMANLLGNALKYSPETSTIQVNISAEEGFATVAVRDQGIGIAEEAIPNLFQRFYRVPTDRARAIPGTGLGLYTCKLVVEAHGGRIWAESEKGVGSTFYFTLPLAI